MPVTSATTSAVDVAENAEGIAVTVGSIVFFAVVLVLIGGGFVLFYRARRSQ